MSTRVVTLCVRGLWFFFLLGSQPILMAADDPQPSETLLQSDTFTPATLRAFDQSGKLVVHTTLPDGSLMADHRGSLGHVTMARFAADGTIETFCTSHEGGARHWLTDTTGPRSATPQPKVEPKN